MEMQVTSELKPYSAYLPDLHLLSTQEFLFCDLLAFKVREGKTQVQVFCFKKKINKISEFKELNLSHCKKYHSERGNAWLQAVNAQ